ncbi:MAG: LytTR family DNA-binding domain-containing protein [Bacteroidota bacterium]
MIKAIIVEDEKNSRIALRQMILEDCPEVEIIAESAEIHESITLINREQPDLVFLDIRLGNTTSFEILKNVDYSTFDIIFTTAYEDYALKAFRFSAIDYLLKPINRNYLRDAIKKLLQKAERIDNGKKIETLLSNMSQSDRKPKRIILSTQEMITVVDLKDIIRCEANVNYTRFIINGQKDMLISRTLKDFEEELSDCDFMRVHKSHLINLRFVKGYDKREGGSIVLPDDVRVPISPRKRDLFMERLKRMMI